MILRSFFLAWLLWSLSLCVLADAASETRAAYLAQISCANSMRASCPASTAASMERRCSH